MTTLHSLAELRQHAAEVLPLVTCPTGKRPHFTSAGAIRHLQNLAASGYAVSVDRLRVYLCPACERYHVGHLPGGRR